MSDIGKTIKNRREELGLSQEELAKMVGYKGKSSINKIETGIAGVPQPKTKAFANALGISINELIGEEEELTLNQKALSFSTLLAMQMNLLGWQVLYDSEGNVILLRNGKAYPITQADIEQLEKMTALYIDFQLNNLIDKEK